MLQLRLCHMFQHRFIFFPPKLYIKSFQGAKVTTRTDGVTKQKKRENGLSLPNIFLNQTDF